MVKKIIKFLVRFGFVVRGFIYFLTGLSGLIVVVGIDSYAKNTLDIVKILALVPFGKVILIAIFLGFIGYGLWGIVRTLRKGEIMARIGYLVSGLSYLILSFIPLHLFLNLKVVNTTKYKIWSQFLIDIPYGYLGVIIIGLIITTGGVSQIIYSLKEKFEKTLINMDKGKRKNALVATGKFGYTVRGIIFTLIGFFFVQSGVTGNSSITKDIGEVLMWSWQQSGGQLILGTISMGFIALGIYSVITSKIVNLSNEKN